MEGHRSYCFSSSKCEEKEIPKQVWDCGSAVRVLDISENFIKEVPARISSFGSMQKLFLQGNGLSDESIQWEGIASLKRLLLLSISHNNLTVLPSAVGSLTSLRQLYVANNKLTSIPNELGLLTQLEILKANNNRLSTLPESIGNCSFIMEIDLSANILSELPETFTKLCNLKTLEVNNTGLKTLPSVLFKMCLQLSTLGLHNTEITVEFLRHVCLFTVSCLSLLASVVNFELSQGYLSCGSSRDGKILMKDDVPNIRSSLILGLWGLANSMKVLINLGDRVKSSLNHHNSYMFFLNA